MDASFKQGQDTTRNAKVSMTSTKNDPNLSHLLINVEDLDASYRSASLRP